MDYPIWLLKLLQGAIVLVLGVLSGIALSLSTWVQPIILRPETSSLARTAGFTETITRGGNYLQPTSRAMGATLLATTLLVSQHPDPADAWKWKLYATAMVIFALVSWYEIVFVFPINDEVKAIGGKLEKAGDEQLSEPEQKRLAGLLTQWEKRHRVRIAIPLAGLVLSIAAILL